MRELVFVDGALADAGVVAQLRAGGAEVVVLDPAQDGFQQMAAFAAATQQPFDTIHLVSHGAAGELQLADARLNLATLDRYAPALQALQAALQPDGDLLLYGCDLAASEDGRTLVERLAELTGADVAASTDLTGAQGTGGDDALEFHAGAVEAQALALPQQLGTLASWAITNLRPNPPGDNYGAGIYYGQELTSPYVQGNFRFSWNGYAEEDSHTIAFGTHWTGQVGVNFVRAAHGTDNTQITVETVDGSEIWLATFKLSVAAPAATAWTFTGYRDGSVVTPSVTVSGIGTGDNLVSLNNPAFANVDKVVVSTASGAFRGQTFEIGHAAPITGATTGAQLAPGDIALIGYDGYNYNAAFIALADLPGDHLLYITTAGWNSSTGNWITPQEGQVTNSQSESFILWRTPPGGVAAGTVMNLAQMPGTVSTEWVTLNADAGDPAWPTMDQLSIFELAADGSPSFVYAANITGAATGANGFHTTFGANAWAEGGLPTGLTAAADGGVGSAWGNVPAGMSGALKPGALADGMSRDDVLKAIHTPANWETMNYDDVPPPTGYDFAARFTDITLASADAIAPQVDSIARTGDAITSASAVAFTVKFSEDVTGVDASDFATTATGSVATGSMLVTGSGSTYTVTVGGITGDGTLRLDLNGAGTGIQDQAGNAIAGGFTAGPAYTLDNTPPDAPAAPSLVAASDSGTLGDGITSDGTPEISGTAPADAQQLAIFVDGKVASQFAAAKSWTTTLPALSDGTHVVTVKATDALGNVSAASAPLTLTVDTTAPTVAIGASPGLLKAGETAVVQLEFSEDPGASFSLADFSVTGGTLSGLAGGGTAWVASFTPQAGFNGKASIAVNNGSWSDAAGNIGSGASVQLQVDTLPPAAPSQPALATPSDTGTLGDALTSDNTPTLVGTAEAGSTVRVMLGGGKAQLLGTTSADGSGAWSFTPGGTLADGAHEIYTIATDAAGNASPDSATFAFTVDSTAPAPLGLALATDSGASSSDGVTNDATLQVTGVEAGASWSYSTDGSSWNAGAGTTLQLPLADGTHTVQVRQTDAAGNTSLAASNKFTLDTKAPDVNSAVRVGDAITNAKSVTYQVDFSEAVTGVDASFFKADGIAGGSIIGVTGSGSLYNVEVGNFASDGNSWLLVVKETAGGIQDLAGNTVSTAVYGTQSYVIDTTPPAAPSGLALAPASDTGASNADGITADTTPTITGRSESGARVVLYVDGAQVGETTADPSGDWSFGPPAFAPGSYTVQAVAHDAAGNASPLSAPLVLQIDTAAAAPQLALAQDTGSSGSDGITGNGVVDVTLAGDVASWQYSIDGGKAWQAGSGTSFALAEGSYAAGSLQVKQVDLAGNASLVAGSATTIVVDTTVATPTFALLADTGASLSDGITAKGALGVAGLEVGATWEYSLDAGASWQAGSGKSFTLPEGTHAAGRVQVRQTDLAGNQGKAASNASALTLDRTVAAPSFALAADTGASGSDGITANAQVNVTLAADVASWEYSTDGGGSWQAGSGSSFTLAEGSYAAGAVQVRQVDIAGNQSGITSSAGAWVVDTTAAAPALALADDTGSSGSDGITRNPQVGVTLAADVASWEYSVDGGAQWQAGSGTSFTLAGGSYAAGALQVRQTDLAGNQSSAGSNAAAITVDGTVAAPGLALAADTGASGSDGITSNTQVDVTLAADAASWQYSTDGGASWNIGSGKSFTLAEGSYAAGRVQVRQTDVAGNLSAATGNAATLVVDTSIAAPALALAADTGTSNSDGLTRNAQVDVTLAADVAGWDYSTDGGASWNVGSGKSFTLAEGTHAAGSVRVRQTDTAGNQSADAANAAAIEVDTSVPAPTLALASDTGSSAADGITRSGQVDVTLAADAASWDYSLDEGASWQAGSGTSFTLAGEGAWRALVRQTDNAGNVSAASAVLAVTVDATAPTLDAAASTPADHAGNIGVNTQLVLRFSEPLDPASDTTQVELRRSADDSVVRATISIDARGALVIAPTSPLAHATPYYVHWQAGALRDAAGNTVAPLAPADAYDFRTEVELPPAGPAPGTGTLVDGVPVQVETGRGPDGRPQQTVTVPVVTTEREESVGDNTVADIPLVTTTGGDPLLQVQVPTGLGLVASGPPAPQDSATGLLTLLGEIRGREAFAGTEPSLLDGGRAFLQQLAAGTPLLVQTLVLEAAPGGSAAGEPLVIRGQAGGNGTPATALVIDARHLPPGTQLQLHDIDFAVVLGPASITGGSGAQTVWADDGTQTLVLGPGDDELHGGPGDDTVGSEAGNDRLGGGAGNDLLFGGAGQDLLLGGSGQDTARYDGARADYRIEGTGPIVTVRSLLDPSDADTLVNVETLRFADQAVTLDTGWAPASVAQGIAGLYVAFFDRAPDHAGLTHWLAQAQAGASLASIAGEFANVSKFHQLYPQTMAAGEFVAAVYENILGIEGDAAGRAWWTARVEEGGLGRSEFVADFVTAALNFNAATSTATGADLANATMAHDTLANKVAIGLHHAAALAGKSNGAIDSAAYQQSVELLAGVDAGAASLERGVLRIDLIGGHSGFGSAVAQAGIFL